MRTGRCRTRPSDTARPRGRALGRRGATAGAREAGRKLRARRRLRSRARLCGKKSGRSRGGPRRKRVGTRWRHQGREKKNNGPQTATHRPRTRAAGKSRPESPLKPHDLREGAAKRQNAPPESPRARGGVGAGASTGRWRGSIGDGSGSSRQDRQERECARPAWRRPPAHPGPPRGGTCAPSASAGVEGPRWQPKAQPGGESTARTGPRAARPPGAGRPQQSAAHGHRRPQRSVG